MDSGYLEPGETMEDDYDFSQVLLPEEIIGIIDQLLCYEVRNPVDLDVRITNGIRWHGTWDILSRRQFSQACTLTEYCLRRLRH